MKRNETPFFMSPIAQIGYCDITMSCLTTKTTTTASLLRFFPLHTANGKITKGVRKEKKHQRMSRTISTPYPNRIRLEIKIELNIRQSLRKLSSINVLDSLDGTLPARPHTHTETHMHGKVENFRNKEISLALSHFPVEFGMEFAHSENISRKLN